MGQRIERAMILGAGLGTRMRPLTRSRPKPLVELKGKPLIDHVLARLVTAGIRTVVVNVHYLADQLEEHLSSKKDIEIIISDERSRRLDTGGGVRKALEFFESDPFIVHNVDSIWLEGRTPTLGCLCASWDPQHMDSLLLLAPTTTCIGYAGPGDFILSPDGRLTRRREQQLVPFVFAGVSIAHPKLFEKAPKDAFSLNKIWDQALQVERLYGVRHDGVWMHVGSIDALERAEQVLSSEHD